MQRLWQVYPYPGDECALNTANYIAALVTNVGTGLLIIYIPMPLLWKLQLPPSKKLTLAVWLCSGVFMIFAAVIRCILCLRGAAQLGNTASWSVREILVSTFVANLPAIKPMFDHYKSRLLATDHDQGFVGKHSAGKSAASHRLSTVDPYSKQVPVPDIRFFTNSSQELIMDPEVSNRAEA
ncbi:hypothetical protein NX059_010914 [Plenodomus lindquistii]|nr:hypothetical protein NX059_010914 [Plenodomus lindquistii]